MASNIFHWTGEFSTDPNLAINWEGGNVPTGTDIALVFDASAVNSCEGTITFSVNKLIVESGFLYGVGSEETPFSFTGSPALYEVKAGNNNFTGSSGSIASVRVYGATNTVFRNTTIVRLETGGSVHSNSGNPQFAGSVTLSGTCPLNDLETGMDSGGLITLESLPSIQDSLPNATIRGRGVTVVCNRAIIVCELNDAPEGLSNTFMYTQTSHYDESVLVASSISLNSPSHSRAKFYHSFNQTIVSLTDVGGTVSFEGHSSGAPVNIVNATISNAAVLNLRNNTGSITAATINILNSDCELIVDDDAILSVSPPSS